MAEPAAADKKLIAICGKGGTGKTAFTAMLTKVLLDSGRGGKLLLIDADPAMGLPLALGVTVERTMGQIREEIIHTARRGGEEEKRQVVDMIDYMAFEALHEEEQFALLAMGRTETLGCFCPINSILKETIQTLSKSFDTIIIDGEAGLEQINRQVVGKLDILIIVSDATSRGLLTAAQVKKLVMEEHVIKCGRLVLVFNRVQGNEDILAKAAADIGVEVAGYIPQDEDVAYHDLVGKPLTEIPDSPAIQAVRRIVEEEIFPERFAASR